MDFVLDFVLELFLEKCAKTANYYTTDVAIATKLLSWN